MKSNLTNDSIGDFPIGTVISFAGKLNDIVIEEQGWLYCNGNTLNRTKYAALFSVIGTNFGDGDGQSSFNLPDFRGVFLRGVTADTKNDPDVESRASAIHGGNKGDNVGSVQKYATGKPATDLITNLTGNHSHTASHIPTDNSSYAIAGGYQAIWNGDSRTTDSAGNHTHSVTGGGDAESRPVNVNTFFLIKFS